MNLNPSLASTRRDAEFAGWCPANRASAPRFSNAKAMTARPASWANDFGKTAVMVDDDGEDEDYLSSSDWVLVSGDAEVFNRNFFKGHGIETAPLRAGLRPWTDDYSNLFQILK